MLAMVNDMGPLVPLMPHRCAEHQVSTYLDW